MEKFLEDVFVKDLIESVRDVVFPSALHLVRELCKKNPPKCILHKALQKYAHNLDEKFKKDIEAIISADLDVSVFTPSDTTCWPTFRSKRRGYTLP
jgi:hypothetical protein